LGRNTPPAEPVAIVPPVHVAPESVLCAANNPLPLAMLDTANNRGGLVGSIAIAPSF